MVYSVAERETFVHSVCTLDRLASLQHHTAATAAASAAACILVANKTDLVRQRQVLRHGIAHLTSPHLTAMTPACTTPTNKLHVTSGQLDKLECCDPDGFSVASWHLRTRNSSLKFCACLSECFWRQRSEAMIRDISELMQRLRCCTGCSELPFMKLPMNGNLTKSFVA